MNEAIERELNDTFAGQFMRPQIVGSLIYYAVETNNGTEYVPGDLVILPFGWKLDQTLYVDDERWLDLAFKLRDYCEAKITGEITIRRGYLARLSASGYMDCTDWSAHATEDEAAQYLIDTYGD